MNLTNHPLTEKDIPYLKETVKASKFWQEEEVSHERLVPYIEKYKELGGDWLVWNLDLPVAFTYHLENAPSNQRTWLGTILVHPKFRNNGLAKRVIEQIAEKCKEKGEKVLYVACPVNQTSWLSFLSNCGFEQFKIEEDKQEEKQYIILVYPIIDD